MNVPAKPITTTAPSLLMDPGAFEHMQRVGGMLALSPLFPDHLRKGSKETAIANGVLVMNMAARLNEDPLTVAQNIYFVSGKPGWATAYMIAKANQHGVFENPIDWKISGKGDGLSVTAFATLQATGREVSATCDMAMAKAENWTKNSKYQSMPETMLRYRSAAFLIRFYCPEVMVGVPSQIEIELGMKDITPDYARSGVEARAEPPVDGDVVDETAGAQEPDQSEPEAKPTTEQAKPEREQPKEETAQEEKSDKAPDPAQFQGLYDMILRDLADAPSVDMVLEMYGAQVEQMKTAAPSLHSDLQGHIAEYRKAEQGDEG
jgi:hypothetical protein